jgi:hypothetical protein
MLLGGALAIYIRELYRRFGFGPPSDRVMERPRRTQ